MNVLFGEGKTAVKMGQRHENTESRFERAGRRITQKLHEASKPPPKPHREARRQSNAHRRKQQAPTAQVVLSDNPKVARRTTPYDSSLVGPVI